MKTLVAFQVSLKRLGFKSEGDEIIVISQPISLISYSDCLLSLESKGSKLSIVPDLSSRRASHCAN